MEPFRSLPNACMIWSEVVRHCKDGWDCREQAENNTETNTNEKCGPNYDGLGHHHDGGVDDGVSDHLAERVTTESGRECVLDAMGASQPTDDFARVCFLHTQTRGQSEKTEHKRDKLSVTPITCRTKDWAENDGA